MKKVAEFLKKDLSTEVMEHIAEKCSFDKLKTANATVKKRSESIAKRVDKASHPEKKPLGPPDMYRKGKHTFEPRHEKTNVLVSDLVRYKPGCTDG